MKRWILAVLFFLALVSVSRAQSGYTTVTATVIDQNGFHYVGCHGSASFVPSPSATLVPTIGGSTFQTDVPIAGCDSFGSFTIVLADNNVVQDGHTSPPASQWQFNIISQNGLTAFNCTMTITGPTQNITPQLTACSAPLPVTPGGGGGGFIVTPETCASTMVFTLGSIPFPSANTAFTTTLNCNVATTSVVATSGLVLPGTIAQFTFTQNAAGGFNVTWPANFVDKPLIQAAPFATTNASFWYDGTNWHAQTFPASGTGSPPSGPAGTIQSTNGSTFSSSAMTEAGGVLTVAEDLSLKGPNPYIDARTKGVRGSPTGSAPAIPGITANCSSGSPVVSISAASSFQNLDGVNVFQHQRFYLLLFLHV